VKRNLKLLHDGLSLLIAAAVLAVAAAPTRASDGETATGRDEQYSDGGSWGFRRAAATDPKLPRVLLIGDSIANGYHQQVAAKLKGKANVDLWITPKHIGDKNMIPHLASVLKNGPYKVIHFNESGLHAWVKGRIPEGQYGPLFERYVQAIKKHAGAAALIWASSTPVTMQGKPDALDAEVNATVVEHNQACRKVADKQKIPVNDLYALMRDKLNLARGDRWHWTKAGCDIQAAAVSDAISKLLNVAPAD
jgi:hypothetical protein